MGLLISKLRSASFASLSLPEFNGVLLAILIGAVFVPAGVQAQSSFSVLDSRDRVHDSEQWAAIAQHLPNRVTSTPAMLEGEGDILRARRFPEDANDYYNFALQNGGDPAVLLGKIGLTALEMKDVPWARAYFKRVVEIDRGSADGWNNLGTVELLSGRVAFAISDYEQAVKRDKSRVVFHCNLAMAYFQRGETRSARKEMAAALKLDPRAFEGGDEVTGAATRVLSAADRGRLALEMAKFYARGGDEGRMFYALAVSSEAGVDLAREMRRDAALSRYAKDAQVMVLMHNAQALGGGPRDATRSSARVRMPANLAVAIAPGEELNRPEGPGDVSR